MTLIFINYRRTDEASAAALLETLLAEHYGPDAVFRDGAGIQSGIDFRTPSWSALVRAPVLLVVIGQHWSGADGPSEHVCDEIALARALGKTVIPVLVGGARLPAIDEIPARVDDLTRRRYVMFEPRTARYDIARVVDAVDMAVDHRPAAAPDARTLVRVGTDAADPALDDVRALAEAVTTTLGRMGADDPSSLVAADLDGFVVRLPRVAGRPEPAFVTGLQDDLTVRVRVAMVVGASWPPRAASLVALRAMTGASELDGVLDTAWRARLVLAVADDAFAAAFRSGRTGVDASAFRPVLLAGGIPTRVYVPGYPAPPGLPVPPAVRPRATYTYVNHGENRGVAINGHRLAEDFPEPNPPA